MSILPKAETGPRAMSAALEILPSKSPKFERSPPTIPKKQRDPRGLTNLRKIKHAERTQQQQHEEEAEAERKQGLTARLKEHQATVLKNSQELATKMGKFELAQKER